VTATTACFRVGDRVRASVALGGWTGTVEKVEPARVYVRKDRADGRPSKVGTWCRTGNLARIGDQTP
jgi:hypothetical protein